jgi:hypothetical protein
MKYFIALAIVSLFSFAPHSSKDLIVKGKLVYSSCGSAVVQVQDAEFYYLGQEKWKRNNESEYEHVFTVRNRCDFLKKKIKVGEEFYFKVIEDVNENNGCVQCLMYESTPYARASIEVVPNNK